MQLGYCNWLSACTELQAASDQLVACKLHPYLQCNADGVAVRMHEVAYAYQVHWAQRDHLAVSLTFALTG